MLQNVVLLKVFWCFPKT